MEYVPRIIDRELDELLPHVAAIALDGPKGVGKTATGTERSRSILNLDVGATRAVVEADPTSILSAAPPVLVDEWQRVPETWDVVRRAVDDGATPGAFLLTGSATPPAAAEIHSGAGRIVSLRMRPMAICERQVSQPTVSFAELLSGAAHAVRGRCSLTLVDYATEIEASGFPAIRKLAARARRAQLDAYLTQMLGRDVGENGFSVRRPDSLRAWLTAYAAATATTATYNAIARAASPGDGDPPTRVTTERYRNLLTALWLLDPIPPWLPPSRNLGALSKAPKHHLADPALALRLLRVSTSDLLRGFGSTLAAKGTPLLGALFESLAALSVQSCAQAAEATVSHLRSRRGEHEIDFIVQGHDGRILAIEAKLAAAVTDADVRHLIWLRAHNPDITEVVVVNTGPEAYRRPDGVVVVPLGLLGP